MNPVAAQQVALDNALVAPEKRLKFEKCNVRIEFSKPQRETTYQVILDVLKLSPYYPTFLVTAEVPEIYMHQFWKTINKIKDTDAYQFKLDKKKLCIDTEELGYIGKCDMLLRSILIKCTSLGENLILSSIGGSSDRADSESEAPDEPKGDSGDEVNEQEEEETQDDKYVHTPKDYVPTNDETNDESDDVTEEDYERINKELYGDVNISLTDAEPDDKEKDDEEMTVVGHVNFNQEGTCNQVKDDVQATQNTEDINVQHEVLHTSPLLTIMVSVILKHIIVNQPKIVTTASSTTISSLLSSLFPHIQQLISIPTPTTTAITSTTIVLDSETHSAFHQRIIDLEKDVKELKTVDHFASLFSTIKSKVDAVVVRDFYKKFYNFLGIVPNHCSGSSIGKT
nr:hypothetical protein [Tanacetum cinerariifolium]